MAQTFKSKGAIQKYLQKEINAALKNEVANEIKAVKQDAIQENVYDVYTPSHYIRRGKSGGLLDKSNMKAELLEDGVIVVKNETPPNPNYPHSDLSRPHIGWAVEQGRGYFFHNPGARPFIQPTVDELKQNKQHVNALMDGLKKMGFNVKRGG